MGIFELNKRLQELDFDQLVDEAFRLTEEELLRLNKAQLLVGDDSEGGKMPFYKSKSYTKKKLSMGSKAGGRVDLKLKNEYQNKFKEIITKDEVTISSDDVKAVWLEKRYGKEKIYGLTDPNQSEYNFNVFYPILMKLLNEKFTGNQN